MSFVGTHSPLDHETRRYLLSWEPIWSLWDGVLPSERDDKEIRDICLEVGLLALAEGRTSLLSSPDLCKGAERLRPGLGLAEMPSALAVTFPT